MDIFYVGEDRWFNDVLVRNGQNWIEGDRLSRLLAHPEWVAAHPSSEPTLPIVEVEVQGVPVTPESDSPVLNKEHNKLKK